MFKYYIEQMQMQTLEDTIKYSATAAAAAAAAAAR